jgi:putative transcriptional regulator
MIRNRMAEIMGLKGLKISDLHRTTGIARTTLSLIYHNDSISISFDVLDKLLMALGVQPNDFFEFEPFDIQVNVIIEDIDKLGAFGYVEIRFINITGVLMHKFIIDIRCRLENPQEENLISYYLIYTDSDATDSFPSLSLGIRASVAVMVIREVGKRLNKEFMKIHNIREDDDIEIRLITSLVESTGFISQSYWDNF